MYYLTELDGFKKIKSEKIEVGEFVTVYDKIYDNEKSLYKVKGVKGNKLNMGLVKVLNLPVVTEEDDINPKQLYVYQGVLLFTDAKVNKNQTITFNNVFYTVIDLMKLDNGSRELVLSPIDVTVTQNIYTIYRMPKSGGNNEVYLQIDNYLEAIITLGKLRGKRDDYYYRFI